VVQAVKDRNRTALSVAPNSACLLRFILADWETWERQGLVDELILQVYRNLNIFINELELPEVQAARRHIPVSVGILTGVKRPLYSLRQIQNQVVSQARIRCRSFSTKLCGIWQRRSQLNASLPSRDSSQYRWSDRIFRMVETI